MDFYRRSMRELGFDAIWIVDRCPSHRAGTSIYYVPLIQAGAPSVARQLAYAEHQPLLGPDDDPNGWQTLEPVTVRGTVFGNREVAVDFKVCSLRRQLVSRALIMVVSAICGAPSKNTL